VDFFYFAKTFVINFWGACSSVEMLKRNIRERLGTAALDSVHSLAPPCELYMFSV